MKLYLRRNSGPISRGVHGVDYIKGNPCGRIHEFWTRDCVPVVFTEEDKEASKNVPEGDWVELKGFKPMVVNGAVFV